MLVYCFWIKLMVLSICRLQLVSLWEQIMCAEELRVEISGWLLGSDFRCTVIGIKERVPFLTSASLAISDYFFSVRNACNFGVALLAFCARMNRFSLVNSHQVENHTHFLLIRQIQGRVHSTPSLWILWDCHGWHVSVWGCVCQSEKGRL